MAHLCKPSFYPFCFSPASDILEHVLRTLVSACETSGIISRATILCVLTRGEETAVTISFLNTGESWWKNLYLFINVSLSFVADLRHADRWSLVILGPIARFYALFRCLSIPRLWGVVRLNYVRFAYMWQNIWWTKIKQK